MSTGKRRRIHPGPQATKKTCTRWELPWHNPENECWAHSLTATWHIYYRDTMIIGNISLAQDWSNIPTIPNAMTVACYVPLFEILRWKRSLGDILKVAIGLDNFVQEMLKPEANYNAGNITVATTQKKYQQLNRARKAILQSTFRLQFIKKKFLSFFNYEI